MSHRDIEKIKQDAIPEILALLEIDKANFDAVHRASMLPPDEQKWAYDMVAKGEFETLAAAMDDIDEGYQPFTIVLTAAEMRDLRLSVASDKDHGLRLAVELAKTIAQYRSQHKKTTAADVLEAFKLLKGY